MVYTIVRHKVADYAVWRKAFDDFLPTRQAGGEQSAVVLQAADDPNDVTVINTWGSLDSAKAFITGDDIRKTMSAAGVTSAPDILYANEA